MLLSLCTSCSVAPPVFVRCESRLLWKILAVVASQPMHRLASVQLLIFQNASPVVAYMATLIGIQYNYIASPPLKHSPSTDRFHLIKLQLLVPLEDSHQLSGRLQ
jgi:hypothetical protein